ncbi:MAG: glycosyltransferase family 39 protein [Candidatus Bathyarchaeota archaeon]|nr:glycosyltransferase family 39 protein [Candidatus Bathyarchaeota archaeon]
MGIHYFEAAIREHIQLIVVLAAVLIVYLSMGTYINWDAKTEFEAATSVVKMGFPYLSSGLIINQAPLGFYLIAPVLLISGISYPNAVGFVTAFGLGCVVLVYVLGTLLYGKKTGLVAAALFGLVPWHVFMSRVYLIDAPCLFFSLLFLVFGVLAVKQNSQRLIAASGFFFALAFLTKLFAVFLAVPLLLAVMLQRKEGFKLTPKKALIFLAPSFILQAIWYGGFANQHFFGVYFPTDFIHPVTIPDPSLVYLPRLFVESAGWVLPVAATFSLLLAIYFRHMMPKALRMDLLCVFTILAVAAVDLVLVFGRGLLVPYVSAFKYTYAALPFLCLLAASLADKAAVLFGSGGQRWLKGLLAAGGLLLVFASLFESTAFLNHSEPYPLIDFKVDYVGHYFPFNVYTSVSSYFAQWHYFALALIVLALASPIVLGALKLRLRFTSS